MPLTFNDRHNPITPDEHDAVLSLQKACQTVCWLKVAKDNISKALHICTIIIFQTSEHNSDRVTTSTTNCLLFFTGILDKVIMLIQHSAEAIELRLFIQQIIMEISTYTQFGLFRGSNAQEVRWIHQKIYSISLTIGSQEQHITGLLAEAERFKSSMLYPVSHLYDQDSDVSSGSELDFWKFILWFFCIQQFNAIRLLKVNTIVHLHPTI